MIAINVFLLKFQSYLTNLLNIHLDHIIVKATDYSKNEILQKTRVVDSTLSSIGKEAERQQLVNKYIILHDCLTVPLCTSVSDYLSLAIQKHNWLSSSMVLWLPHCLGNLLHLLRTRFRLFIGSSNNSRSDSGCQSRELPTVFLIILSFIFQGLYHAFSPY